MRSTNISSEHSGVGGKIRGTEHSVTVPFLKVGQYGQGWLGFELWPRFSDFARFFCAFALKLLSETNRMDISFILWPSVALLKHRHV